MESRLGEQQTPRKVRPQASARPPLSQVLPHRARKKHVRAGRLRLLPHPAGVSGRSRDRWPRRGRRGCRALGRWRLPCPRTWGSPQASLCCVLTPERGGGGGVPATSPPPPTKADHQPCLRPGFKGSKDVILYSILYFRGRVRPAGSTGPSCGLCPINTQRARPALWCCSRGPTGTRRPALGAPASEGEGEGGAAQGSGWATVGWRVLVSGLPGGAQRGEHFLTQVPGASRPPSHHPPVQTLCLRSWGDGRKPSPPANPPVC